MFAWLMHLMSKMFGGTAKKNMEKMETANNAEEDEEEEETAEEESEDSSDDDDEGSGGDYEDNIHSSAQGGFG
jgi:hypothetical protein